MRNAFLAVAVSMTAASGAAVAAPVVVTSPWLAGTWSFDGSCASGDGMTLEANGKAGFDEWGLGLWALADKGTRLVLIVEDVTEEADRKKVAQLIEYRVSEGAGVKMTLVRLSDNATLHAVKCARK
ncbi:MAG: hypothetical protein K8S25_14885 [Alphaproteobacteria bacterium]|nr:hypothetical protein [Alphaproteobacteria bacterium]